MAKYGRHCNLILQINLSSVSSVNANITCEIYERLDIYSV